MMELIMAFTGSVCAGIIFNISRRNLFWTGASGLLGWAAYSLVLSLSGSTVLSTFVGAVVIGLFSELTARLLKAPSTLFSVTGIFPIVPGIAAYEAVSFITRNELQQAALKAVETAGSAGSIAFGILLVTSIFRLGSKILRKVKSS